MRIRKRDAAGNGRDRIRRFPTTRIVEHLVLVVLFILLSATGMAQKFHSTEVSQWIFTVVDGVDRARDIHHYAGIALIMLLLMHAVTSAWGFIALRRRPSMLVSLQDLRDAAHNMRYYLGFSGRPAACDRYDYKQKFTYWLVLTGGVLMALTGLALWFPVETARYLPVSVIPLAASLHSHQALVILLVVAVWHIYDSIFSPDVFPLDTSIFTGYTTRARMRRLHLKELERLERVGRAGPGGDAPPPLAKGPGGS